MQFMALCYGSLSKQTQSTRRGKCQLVWQYLGRKRINGEFIVKINILCSVVLQNKMSWEEQASKGHNNYYLQLFSSRAPLTVVWRLPPCGQGWIVLGQPLLLFSTPIRIAKGFHLICMGDQSEKWYVPI